MGLLGFAYGKDEESVEESDMGLLGHETYGLVK